MEGRWEEESKWEVYGLMTLLGPFFKERKGKGLKGFGILEGYLTPPNPSFLVLSNLRDLEEKWSGGD